MAVKLKLKKFRSRFFFGPVRRRIDRACDRNAQRAAEELLERTVRNITTSHAPPHSRPGSFPATETGDLAASGRVEEMHEPDGQYAAVVFDASHARHVERLRPFLSRTAEEERGSIARELSRRLWGMFSMFR